MAVSTLSRAIRAANPDVLRAIWDEDVSIAIWERERQSWAANIALADVRKLTCAGSLCALPALLEHKLASAGVGKGLERSWLASDIVTLATHFGAVMRLNEVEVRLEHVTTDACRKFHGDYVTARLICTYVGPGTQWLDGRDPEDCDCGEPHQVQQMMAGDVGLLKGRLWSESHPAIHRSPPIEGSGQDRLVLVINPVPTKE